MREQDPSRIADMFDAIAPRYDLLNHLLSAGLDRRWRARAVGILGLTGREVVLDLCTGTADLAIALVDGRRGGGARAVMGMDFSGQMLTIGRDKVRRLGLDRAVRLLRADASRVPLRDHSADAVTVAFGIRNVEDREATCREISRVLRPGGRIAILEFGMPRCSVLRTIYAWYFTRLLPLIGRLVSRHAEAYEYLPASVASFPSPAAFESQLVNAGFVSVTHVPLTFGIVLLYSATKR